MAQHRAQRVLAAAALVLAAVAGLRAAEPQPAPAADRTADPPPGTLLIAAATMQDPRFARSVVLLVKHDGKGAFGIIVNKPVAEQPIAALLAAGNDRQDPSDKIDGSVEVYYGGPVQPQLGFILHSAEYRRPETLAVGAGIAMTASRDILRDIGRHQGPQKYLFALGYAGWGAGQLDGEIARRDWFSAPADPELVFDADRAKLWDQALARRSQEL